MNVSVYQKRRKKAPERNTCTNQPLKFNLVTLKFLLLFEVSNIVIGSAVEGIISQSQLHPGKQCPVRRSNLISCLYSSEYGLSVRPGEKNPEICSLACIVPIKCNQLLNQSFAFNKVSYLFPSNSPPGFLTIVQTDTTSSFCKGRV